MVWNNLKTNQLVRYLSNCLLTFRYISGLLPEDNGLKLYLKMKHSGLIQKHSCYQCSSSFTRKDSLERHVKIQHEGFRLKCEFCEHTSTQKGHLKVHINEVHMKIKQLNEECTLCDFKPRDLYHLKLHINSVHLKLKSKCPHCDFETSHLRAHIRVAHNRDKIRKYQCNLCEYSHINKTQMDIHRNGVHFVIIIFSVYAFWKYKQKVILQVLHYKVFEKCEFVFILRDL